MVAGAMLAGFGVIALGLYDIATAIGMRAETISWLAGSIFAAMGTLLFVAELVRSLLRRD